MYVERKPSLYIEELKNEFKNSLSNFKNNDEAFDTLVAVSYTHLTLPTKRIV